MENFGIAVGYPLIPWCGVMALGYLFGPVILEPESVRRRKLIIAGATMTLLFVVIRGSNLYGDPEPWAAQDRGPLFTFLSYLNVAKYPPSLLFLCMTLGPGLLILVGLERTSRVWLAGFFSVFGRVPLFFYLMHIPVIRVTGLIKNQLLYGQNFDLFVSPQDWPADYVPRLWMAYAAWIVLLAVFFPACVWFGSVKRRKSFRWLSYL